MDGKATASAWGSPSYLTVPTEDQRRGDFSRYNATIYDPLTGTADGSGRTPFPGNIIPLNRQSSITRKVQDLVPLPNRPGTVGNYSASGSQRLDRDNLDLKINWNRRDTHTVWGKYSIMNANVGCDPALGPAGGAPLCQGNIGNGELRTQVATIGHTMTFSPTFLWDGAIGWTRQGQEVTGFRYGEFVGREVLGIPGTNGNGTDVRESGVPVFEIPGYTRLGSDTDTRPFFMHDTSFTLQQNFSWNRSRHQLRFGFEGVRHHLNHYSPDGGGGGGPQGMFIFSQSITGLRAGPALTQYNSYAAFLLGLPEEMRETIQTENMTAYNYQFAWYIHDRWKVTQNLTLSLGLRYELFPLQTRAGRGGIEGYDPETNLVSLGGLAGIPSRPRHFHQQESVRPTSGLCLQNGQQHGHPLRLRPYLQSDAARPPSARLFPAFVFQPLPLAQPLHPVSPHRGRGPRNRAARPQPGTRPAAADCAHALHPQR